MSLFLWGVPTGGADIAHVVCAHNFVGINQRFLGKAPGFPPLPLPRSRGSSAAAPLGHWAGGNVLYPRRALTPCLSLPQDALLSLGAVIDLSSLREVVKDAIASVLPKVVSDSPFRQPPLPPIRLSVRP